MIAFGLSDIIFRFDRMRTKAEKIKADEERRRGSAYFAVVSIIFTVVASVAAVGDAYIALGIGESLGVLIMLLSAISLFAVAAVSPAWSVVHLIFRFSIDKSAWSYIALAVPIAATVGVAAVSIVAF